MRIHQLTQRNEGDLVRISATVTWEDCDRPSKVLYLDTLACFQHDLSCNPNAFLLSAIFPAMHEGEKRIVVEGKLCPKLHNGLDTAIQILRHWYGEAGRSPVMIEATQGFEAPRPCVPHRTASFLSGGVDGLATLCLNRRDYPRDHPASIRDGLLLVNYGFGKPKSLDFRAKDMEEDTAFLGELAEREALTVIPILSNFGALYKNAGVFAREGGGAHLAAIAHAFPARFSTVLISSGDHITELSPWGTHPLLDPNYSSSAVAIRHEGCGLTRLEKVGVIADWDIGLRCLRSCNYRREHFPKGFLNCGRCDKCIRTMMELTIYGKLNRCPTFSEDDVTPEMLHDMKIFHETKDFHPLIEPMKRIGRGDLADALIQKLEAYVKFKASLNKRNWRSVMKRLDRTYLGSHLYKGQRYLRDLLAGHA